MPTHILRPTWHFVTPADIRWLLILTAPRVHAVNASMLRKLGLESAVLKRSQTALAKILSGRQLTRTELRDALQQAGISILSGLHLAYILMSAELDGLICSGARRGKQFTYALLDERAPPVASLDRQTALTELSRRYFQSRDPATVQDFDRWSGLTLADARLGLEAVKSGLVQETLSGSAYWFPPLPPASIELTSPAYLLSIYDEYISGYKYRSAIGEVEVGEKLFALGNALSYIVVLDGQIVGTWKRTLTRAGVTVHIDLFAQLSKRDLYAITAAQRYGAFLQLPVTFGQGLSTAKS
ncbi:MAG TPA: winged helix DNA-binding domain-containing protein [Anaerolineales bacterium]|nr:winged helix DNA-binding domain-containing protein [Anaerolineales bacterium]